MQEFFGQLDQRVLNSFLKACDELTDILPEQEQQSLQETVRKLHKHWKVRGWNTPMLRCSSKSYFIMLKYYFGKSKVTHTTGIKYQILNVFKYQKYGSANIAES